jgi:DNA-binding IclR family transcriptional regulator
MASDRQTGPTDGAAMDADRPMARWLTVLEAYARRSEWGIRDLAAATGLPRSSVHRIVRDMTGLGLLIPAGLNGRAEVGPTLMRLAVGLTEHVDVLRAAGPALDALRDETGETAILTIYDRTRRMFRAVTAAESSHPIRYIWEALQEWSELHVGASGKGILAFLAPDEQRRILAALTDPLPPPSGAPKAAFEASLLQAARDGWVISHGERFAGAVGVAAPVRGADGRVVGSVLLGWPDNRTDGAKERAAARAALHAAREISTALGYEGQRRPSEGASMRPSPAGSGSARASRARSRRPT